MQAALAARCMAAAMSFAGLAAQAGDAGTARERELVRMVRQDCGSCHGMTLKGGLGPPLLPAALAGKPQESLVATVIHGRPGTAMPGWRPFVSDTEARWIVERLTRGFPEESP